MMHSTKPGLVGVFEFGDRWQENWTHKTLTYQLDSNAETQEKCVKHAATVFCPQLWTNWTHQTLPNE